MRTLGVIGGLGPETTADFYLEVVFGCQKKKGDKPPILVWNVPVELRMEEDMIQRAAGEERYIPLLVSAAKRLEKAGADILVMPCNTLHKFIREIREAVQIPVLSIVEETVDFLASRKIREVGVFGTPCTIKNRLYEDMLESKGIRQVLPGEADQFNLGKVICRVVNNEQSEKDREEFSGMIKKLGVRTVIMACTDLQVLKPECPGIEVFDTMKILADASVREILRD